MKIWKSFGGYFKGVSILLLLLAVSGNALACPDCALIDSGGTIEPQTVMAKMAFSVSTLLLLVLFFSVAGFLIWSMVKTCRDLNKELGKEHPLSSTEGVFGRVHEGC